MLFYWFLNVDISDVGYVSIYSFAKKAQPDCPMKEQKGPFTDDISCLRMSK